MKRLKSFVERFFWDKNFKDKLSFFKRVFLFRDLDQRALSMLMHGMMEKNYSDKEVIFEEGDVGRACFIVAQGRVEILQKGNTSETSKRISVIGPGNFFGEMVLLDELPRSATARTLESTRLYILYKSHFDSMINNSPEVASVILKRLARLLSARLRQAPVSELAVEELSHVLEAR